MTDLGTTARTPLPIASSTPIPWEDRPVGSQAVLWRSSRNPIIPRDHIPRANSIFNSAVVPFEDGFAGVFRVDDTSRVMNVHAGRSADGIEWDIDPEPIAFEAGDNRVPEIQHEFLHAYDPRVTWLEDRYYVTWCNGYHGPTIGVDDAMGRAVRAVVPRSVMEVRFRCCRSVGVEARRVGQF